MTVVNGSPSVTMLTSPPLPSSTTLVTSIKSLISYVQTNGINISNHTLVDTTTNEIVSKSKTTLTPSATLTNLYNQIAASTSDSTTLTGYLNTLLTTVEASSTVGSWISPEDDTQTTTGATITAPQRNKTANTTVQNTKFKGLGTKVSGIQSDSIGNAKVNNTFIGLVKGSFNQVTGWEPNHNRPPYRNSFLVANRNGNVSANSNFFANIANSFVNGTNNRNRNRFNNRQGRNFDFPDDGFDTTEVDNSVNNGNETTEAMGAGESRQGRPGRPGSCRPCRPCPPCPPPRPPDYLRLLREFTSTNATTDNTVTLTESVISDTYEVYTNTNGSVLNVTFAYFTAGSASSTFACTYNLTPQSLFSLSMSAYRGSLKLSAAEKAKLTSQAGYTSSSSPSNQDMWNTYLVWMLSFISFGVASYLGADIDVPFSGSVTGSANYMLNQNYLNNVSNVSLPVSLSGVDSNKGALLSTGIAGMWSDLPYSESSAALTSTTSYGSSRTIANSIINLMKKQTATTSSTST